MLLPNLRLQLARCLNFGRGGPMLLRLRQHVQIPRRGDNVGDQCRSRSITLGSPLGDRCRPLRDQLLGRAGLSSAMPHNRANPLGEVRAGCKGDLQIAKL